MTQGSANPGTSWTMSLQLNGYQYDGTYTIHFTTMHLGGGSVAWQYDGFMTLVVTS